MAGITTLTAAKGLHLDVRGFAPTELIPEALILQTSTKAGFVEGDEPAVRCPFVNVDDDAGFVAEGANIPEADPEHTEVVIHTGKVAVLVRTSREQHSQGNAAALVSDSVRRAIIRKANGAYLSQPAPTAPATTPPAGLLSLSPTSGGTVADDFDVVADTLMGIEAANGQATHIVASPSAWASLTKFKAATGSNSSLVGAGVEAAERRLLGVPVIVSNAMTADKILVLDNTAILSAYGNVQLAVSDQAFFASDSVAVRCTFRFGQKLIDPARVVQLTVTDPSV
ncbi:phage major capsid protein [Rhodococcus ruber]|uniref:phage major capsid protein n=1 Tax=Rhodococcus ruber TaxID=1830 RepID=UPI00378506C4